MLKLKDLLTEADADPNRQKALTRMREKFFRIAVDGVQNVKAGLDAIAVDTTSPRSRKLKREAEENLNRLTIRIRELKKELAGD